VRGTSRRGERRRGEAGGSGGHSPRAQSTGHRPQATGATEKLRHVARIRSSLDESFLKIFTDAREEKKIRGRIGDTGERTLAARPGVAVLIWPSERDDTASRRDSKRSEATSNVDILKRFRLFATVMRGQATLFRV